eukprot:SAG11_NODE_4043_length_2089_cov_3.667337_3_plen_40_part_01
MAPPQVADHLCNASEFCVDPGPVRRPGLEHTLSACLLFFL